MKVKTYNLLLIASIVWGLAGFNILRIGVTAYKEFVGVINLGISLAIFIAFWFMVFKKLVIKHTARIKAYEDERTFFLKFFDVKSFMIMAFMMTFGISLRAFNLWPDLYIAVFYTGLGSALFLAGLNFGVNFISHRTDIKKLDEDSI